MSRQYPFESSMPPAPRIVLNNEVDTISRQTADYDHVFLTKQVFSIKFQFMYKNDLNIGHSPILPCLTYPDVPFLR